jgi:hypothetical protein
MCRRRRSLLRASFRKSVASSFPRGVWRARSVDAYCTDRGTSPGCAVFPALVGGDIFRLEVDFTPAPDARRVLGYTQYTQLWSLFTRPVPHYGTTGQWIQARGDGIESGPWASIEGGLVVADKYGGARYHVAASSHRYNNRSDTLGGFGFHEAALPRRYWARVVMSSRMLLPPCGVCFPKADEGKLFGAGWIAMPARQTSRAPCAATPRTFSRAGSPNGPQ